MTVIIQSVVKLLITAYLLFGFYTLFCGFVEKNRKKKIVGTIVQTVPTVLIAVLIIVLYRMYGE